MPNLILDKALISGVSLWPKKPHNRSHSNRKLVHIPPLSWDPKCHNSVNNRNGVGQQQPLVTKTLILPKFQCIISKSQILICSIDLFFRILSKGWLIPGNGQACVLIPGGWSAWTGCRYMNRRSHPKLGWSFWRWSGSGTACPDRAGNGDKDRWYLSNQSRNVLIK